MSDKQPVVSILMESDRDWPKIEKAALALEEFGVPYEAHVMSAHRTPHLVGDFAMQAERRGFKVIIAAAGGAAQLAGVVAAHTTLPVLGLPVPTTELDDIDPLLSTGQMPGDVPVASLAIGMGGPRNAGLFAVQILSLSDEGLRAKYAKFKQNLVRQDPVQEHPAPREAQPTLIGG